MRLMLGTVQFGLNYGINNRLGKPALADSLRMLEFAWERGIRDFDTARAYGDAEEILGEFVRANGVSREIRIVTKLTPNLLETGGGDPASVIPAEAEISLERMGISRLDGFLLHTPSDFYRGGVPAALQHCINQGLTRSVGVSVYETDDALKVAESGMATYIQLPFSVFDRRAIECSLFETAAARGVKVVARSAFLQGLIMMEPHEVPQHLREVVPASESFAAAAARYNMNRAEAAIRYALSLPGISQVVFGVDNMKQLADDLNYASEGPLDDDCFSHLTQSVSALSKAIIFPSLWSKKQ